MYRGCVVCVVVERGGGAFLSSLHILEIYKRREQCWFYNNEYISTPFTGCKLCKHIWQWALNIELMRRKRHVVMVSTAHGLLFYFNWVCRPTAKYGRPFNYTDIKQVKQHTCFLDWAKLLCIPLTCLSSGICRWGILWQSEAGDVYRTAKQSKGQYQRPVTAPHDQSAHPFTHSWGLI